MIEKYHIVKYRNNIRYVINTVNNMEDIYDSIKLLYNKLKIRFGQARERKQLQWRESFNVFSGVGFRCGSKRGKKNVVSMVSHTFG